MLMTFALRRMFGSVVARSQWKRRTAAFIAQEPFAGRPRHDLIEAFAKIDSNVPHLHARGELLFIAEKLLELDISGPIIECGCFKGASAAKLSLVAKLTGRALYV